MTIDRRRLLAAIAVAPALAPSRLLGAGPLDAEAAIPLRASPGADGPPLRYGDGSPVLRVKRGVPARIAFDNALAVPTSLDLAGLRVPPPLGGAGPLGGAVAPGGRAGIAFTPPDAGTGWLHPWILDPGDDQTARGLAGVLVVEEDAPPEVDADRVALLTDRWPLAGIDAPPAAALLVGGASLPRRETLRPGSRLRLRVVNGSTRRAVRIAVSGAVPTVVAIDGQPSEPFRPRGDALPLGPGARCDLMLDLPRTPGAEATLSVRSGAAEDVAMVLRVAGDPRDMRGPVAALPPNPLLPRAIALEKATRATLVAEARPGAGGWSVNGVPGFPLPKAPLFRAKRGAPVSLSFRNAAPSLVGFRVHGFALRVLHDLDDGWEPYWRDCVLVPAGATHHAAFVADLPGRWLIDSPFFDQAAGGFRTWFEIT